MVARCLCLSCGAGVQSGRWSLRYIAEDDRHARLCNKCCQLFSPVSGSRRGIIGKPCEFTKIPLDFLLPIAEGKYIERRQQRRQQQHLTPENNMTTAQINIELDNIADLQLAEAWDAHDEQFLFAQDIIDANCAELGWTPTRFADTDAGFEAEMEWTDHMVFLLEQRFIALLK